MAYTDLMRTVSVREAKTHLRLLLEWVQQGEEILILDRGVPVARLGPVPEVQDEALSLLVRKGLVRPGTGRPELQNLPLPKGQKSLLELLLAERGGVP